MLKFLNKEKKKSQIIQHVLSVEEFFNRNEFDIPSDLWKLNNTQLEETANKLEKFIKHLKEIYQQQLDFLENDRMIQNDTLRKQRNQIEELEIKNESNIQQKELIEKQYKEIYQQIQIKQNIDQYIQTDIQQQQQQNITEEELNRLRLQCEKMSIEMTRLQEENDDISMALDMEKQHKNQIQCQIQQKLEQQQLLQNQIQNQHLEELEILQIKITKEFEINYNVKQKELESKLLQERIKTDQKIKDCQRLEEEIKELKQSLEQQIQLYEQRESKLKLLEQKRLRDKTLIQQLRQDIHNSKHNLQEQNLKLINEINKLNKDNLDLQNQITQNTQISSINQTQQQQNQNIEIPQQEKILKIQQLEFIVNEQYQTIILLEKKLDQCESDSLIKISELQKCIEQLNIKRENAKKEIYELNQRVQSQNSQSDLNTSLSIKHNHHTSNVVKSKQRFQLFPTLKNMLEQLRLCEDQCYKDFMKQIMIQFNDQQICIKIENQLNDINRMTQDILDLLDEIGLI